MYLATFSIAARCPRTTMLGVAVSTAVPAVGALCPRIEPGVGAVSTQAWVNPYLAVTALNHLQAGKDAEQALAAALASDEARNVRQVGVVDVNGLAASWSGSDCTPWFGHRTAPGVAIQGNMLTGPDVLDAMMAAFQESADRELAERLLCALEAGQSVGGDKRGKQSAALLVRNDEAYPYVDLRVDENLAPVAELRRIFGIFKQQVRPFLEGMPRRGMPATPAPESVVSMLLRSPADRPGGTASDFWAELIGLDLPIDRRTELAALFRPIAAEIAKLRSLDLTDVHPAVIFDPRMPS